jgi:hypothetical protein
MNPIRRELVNSVFVLVLASPLSAGFTAFQVSINIQLWALILMAIAIAVGGYVVFEFVLSSEQGQKQTEQRELEWFKRVGNPARLELRNAAIPLSIDLLRTMRPGADYTAMLYVDGKGGSTTGGM